MIANKGQQQFPLFRQKPAARLQETWQSSPKLSERMAHIQLVGKTMGLSLQSADGYFRPTGGPGWALVGDARHYKDPASGQGFHDALYSVQQLLLAIESVTGGNPLTLQAAQSAWPRAMTIIQRRSDRELMPMYTFTYTLQARILHARSLKKAEGFVLSEQRLLLCRSLATRS